MRTINPWEQGSHLQLASCGVQHGSSGFGSHDMYDMSSDNVSRQAFACRQPTCPSFRPFVQQTPCFHLHFWCLAGDAAMSAHGTHCFSGRSRVLKLLEPQRNWVWRVQVAGLLSRSVMLRVWVWSLSDACAGQHMTTHAESPACGQGCPCPLLRRGAWRLRGDGGLFISALLSSRSGAPQLLQSHTQLV